MSYFAKKFQRSTFDTDQFVKMANKHIDKQWKKGKRVWDPFFLAVSAYLSDLNVKQKNGGPFGAVIVEYEGGLDEHGKGIGKPHVIGVGANHVVPNNDPSAHAEMVAYRDAAKRKGYSDLKNTVLFTSCECCPQCLGMANGSGIGRIVYMNTRQEAENIGFSDKLQYDMFKLSREEQMTHIDRLGEDEQEVLRCRLSHHGAVVLNERGQTFAFGDEDTRRDPTGLASLNAIRNALEKYAALQRRAGNTEPVFSLPDGYTLVCRRIPHPTPLTTADWARMLRQQNDPRDPESDNKIINPMRIIHLSSEYEPLRVLNERGTLLRHQDSETTYLQPTLPDNERKIPTERYEGAAVASAAREVFDMWKEFTGQEGAAVKY